MKLSRALMPLLGVALGASSLVACVYSSDAPTPLSSGTGNTTTTDGTDPGTDGGGGGGGGDTDAGGGGGGGGGTDAGKQSGTDAGTQSKDAGQTSNTPTWTAIYASYFAAGSMGNCGAGGCHSGTKSGVKCSDKTYCYNTLTSSGYITGTTSPLADTQQSCLTWYGGNMPPSGGASSKAKTDINAWVAAGALNN